MRLKKGDKRWKTGGGRQEARNMRWETEVKKTGDRKTGEMGYRKIGDKRQDKTDVTLRDIRIIYLLNLSIS